MCIKNLKKCAPNLFTGYNLPNFRDLPSSSRLSLLRVGKKKERIRNQWYDLPKPRPEKPFHFCPWGMTRSGRVGENIHPSIHLPWILSPCIFSGLLPDYQWYGSYSWWKRTDDSTSAKSTKYAEKCFGNCTCGRQARTLRPTPQKNGFRSERSNFAWKIVRIDWNFPRRVCLTSAKLRLPTWGFKY